MATAPPDPAPTSSLLPWAWTIEALADFEPADSALLCALMDRAPDMAGDWFKNARERISLRCLREWLDSSSGVVNEELADQEHAAPGGSHVEIDMSDSSEDVLLKLVQLSAHGKHRAELKLEVEQFIQQKRANLPTSTLYQLKESGLSCFQPSCPSSGEKFDIVRDDKACCIDDDDDDDTSKRRGNKNEPINELKDYPEYDENQLGNKISGTSENGNGCLASGEEGPFQQSMLEGETEENNNDTCMLEQNPAQQPSGNGDDMPQLAHPDGNIAATHHDINQDNVVDDTRIVSPTSISNSDCSGDHKCDSPNKVAAKMQQFLSQSQGSQSTLLSDWTEKTLCIKCEEGGQLLACCNSKCPINVHENCLGSSLMLDESGKFYCPFCSYFRAHATYRQAKRKAAVRKKALSAFMCRDLAKGYSTKNLCAKSPLESAEHRSHIQRKEVSLDQQCGGAHEQVDEPMGDCHNCHTLNKEAKVGSPGVEIFVSAIDQEVFQTKGSNDIYHEVDNEGEDNFILKRRTKKRRRKEDTPLSPVQENPVNLQKSRLQLNVEDGDEKDVFPRKLRRKQAPKKRYSNPCLPVGRRNKLRWTMEEEDVLKELVLKFSDNCKNGIPWREILESGSHTFHKTRTPIDLKDKWRNILKARDR